MVSCNSKGGLRAKICPVDLWMAQLENVLSVGPQGQVLGLESFEQEGFWNKSTCNPLVGLDETFG